MEGLFSAGSTPSSLLGSGEQSSLEHLNTYGLAYSWQLLLLLLLLVFIYEPGFILLSLHNLAMSIGEAVPQSSPRVRLEC